MRIAICLVLTVLAGSGRASPGASMPAVARQYLLARAECGKPGPRISAFMQRYFDHWLSPRTFGRRVIRGWDQLTADQRARLQRLAETKVLAPRRAEMIRNFCDKHDRYSFVLETTATDPAVPGHEILYRKIMIQHRIGDDLTNDWYQVGWVMAEQAGRWSLDSITVPSADDPGMDQDPVPAALRDALAGASFDQAMKLIDTAGTSSP
jgi:hypothetical protein